MNELYDSNADYKYTFDELTSYYEFVNGIPKDTLFVRLNSEITDEQRTYVANGIRNYL